MTLFDHTILQNLYRPSEDSHKGENGKLLVIGGSKLFHASIFWSAEVAAKIVDLVHFTSPAMENNDLVRVKAKEKMWSGIVVPFEEVETYIEEDDVILIGPGMPREEGLMEGERPTKEIVDGLLSKFPDKKWVVDGGALQEAEPMLLNGNMIVTPHQGEWDRLMQKSKIKNHNDNSKFKVDINENLVDFSQSHEDLTILLKGQTDLVGRGDVVVEIEGGNAGLTKGGTGDVLAGVVAALYCTNEAFLAAQAGSFVVKKAGERLAEKVGRFYSAGDVVGEVARVFHEYIT